MKQQSKPVKKNKCAIFESPSKSISLKKFSDDQQFTGTVFSESIYQANNKQQLKELTLQKWFEKLMSHEKAIVLTVIDQDLVTVVKQMHAKYADYGHGNFTNEGPSQISSLQS